MDVPALVLHTGADGPASSRTFVVHGELDLTTTDILLGAARAAMREGLRRLVVDLRRLTFVDSSGLHACALIDFELRAAGGEALFLRAAPQIHRAFEVVGLDGRLAFADRPR